MVLWVIFKRELLDHLMSVRFALTLVLAVVLLALNGILFAGGPFQRQMNDFIENRQNSIKHLQNRAGNLSNLYIEGVGVLYKQPSPLVFCASGRDKYLPQTIYGGSRESISRFDWGLTLYSPWFLRYSTPNELPPSGVVSDFVEIDWVFIIGFVLSLMAVLLTFDSISGERQNGTLALLLSGSVSRTTVLGGKFLGAFFVLALALTLGVLVNLLVITLFGSMILTLQIGLKLATMGVAALLYLAFFVGLGLLVSSRFERPTASLVILLLVWTVLIVLLPNTTAGISSSFEMKDLQWKERRDAVDAVKHKHGIDRLQNPNPEGKMPADYVEKFADYVAEWYSVEHQFEEVFLQQQLAQVEWGRKLNRISPYGVFQYALESLADTGISRHYRFIQDAGEFESVFRNFIKERDASDSESFHLLGLTEGMSHISVPPETVPIFMEDLSARSTVVATAHDLLLLTLFALVAFMASNVAFLRVDVT